MPPSVDTLPHIQLTALWASSSTASLAFQSRESFESLHVNEIGVFIPNIEWVRFRTGTLSLWPVKFLGSGISWFTDIRVTFTIWKNRYNPTFETSSSPFSHCSPGMKHHTIFEAERTTWFICIKDTSGIFCNVLIKVIEYNLLLLSRTVLLDLKY